MAPPIIDTQGKTRTGKAVIPVGPMAQSREVVWKVPVLHPSSKLPNSVAFCNYIKDLAPWQRISERAVAPNPDLPGMQHARVL